MKAKILLCLLALPMAAQAQTTSQPAGQPPAQSGGPPTPPTGLAPIPLPSWFVEIDTAKKGEVTRSDFVRHRMKSFNDLDVNKDGKVSVEEFLKLAEPPFSSDQPGGPSLEERRNRVRSDAPGHTARTAETQQQQACPNEEKIERGDGGHAAGIGGGRGCGNGDERSGGGYWPSGIIPCRRFASVRSGRE